MISASVSQQFRSSSTACSSGRSTSPAILGIVTLLHQLADVVRVMTDQQYQSRSVGVTSSSVGSHLRHSLDHVDALLAGAEQGELDYDCRRRGTEIETSRSAALDAIRRQEQQLFALPQGSDDRPIRLSVMVSASRPPVEVATTLGRELAFVLSHTVHHNAVIAIMARTMGVSVPERFGYAPSTIAYLEKTPCAR